MPLGETNATAASTSPSSTRPKVAGSRTGSRDLDSEGMPYRHAGGTNNRQSLRESAASPIPDLRLKGGFSVRIVAEWVTRFVRFRAPSISDLSKRSRIPVDFICEQYVGPGTDDGMYSAAWCARLAGAVIGPSNDGLSRAVCNCRLVGEMLDGQAPVATSVSGMSWGVVGTWSILRARTHWRGLLESSRPRTAGFWC